MEPLLVAPGNPDSGVSPILSHPSANHPFQHDVLRMERSVRCVNALPILNGAYRRPAPNMQGNQVRLLDGLVEELRDRAQDKRVADPVETVLPQPVRPGHFLVDRVGAHMLGDGDMERGVEVSDAADVGDLASAGADDLQGREVVSISSACSPIRVSSVYPDDISRREGKHTTGPNPPNPSNAPTSPR
jgi:hypothetical protein